ncbi:unnamed protein product [Lactuca saligna]|uniref:Uncharacterized protein n=1 Tax=Lactuca saligna TaxID=75948 RepID=A0AA35YDQ5_LACSI|nr:unnamed protein product [Lactuca saligna]
MQLIRAYWYPFGDSPPSGEKLILFQDEGIKENVRKERRMSIARGGGSIARVRNKGGHRRVITMNVVPVQMAQTDVQLAPTLTPDPQDIRISVGSHDHTKPIPDLLTGTRKEYIKIAIPLYEASIRGDWTAAEEILNKKPELVRYSITANNETSLHVAASAKSTEHVVEFVKNLMTKMKKEDLELKNTSSNTALCLAAAAGNVKIVEIMVKSNRALVAITGAGGMTPLYMAALFGHYETAKCLYGYSQNLRDDCWTPQNRVWLLQKCVETDMFDIALEIVKAYPDLGGNTVLGILAKKTDVFAATESNIIRRTINWVWTCIHPKVGPSKMESKANALELLNIIWGAIAEKPTKEIDNIIRGQPDPIKKDDKPASDTEQTLQLLQKISENTSKKHDERGTATNNMNAALQENARPKYSSRILFVAAEMGNTRFIIELIRLYPDIIWKVNDDNQSIFHTAVKHRHEGIYNLLYEIGSMKDLITPLKDKNDNIMLHLVGKSAKKRRLEDVSGVAFQMQ